MKKVLMVGPARSVKGGMTTVVDNYYQYGLNEKVILKYIESCCDRNVLFKLIKEIFGIIKFIFCVNKFDIVHIHVASRRSTFRKIIYIRISKFYGKKVILHIHGGGFKEFFDNEISNRKQEYIKKWFNKADKIIVLSEEWKLYFSNIVNDKKIIVMYNGVNIPENFEKNFNKNILFMGRICKEKGIFDLLYVIYKLKSKYPDIMLNICGAGCEREVDEFINKYQLKENVTRYGWINGDNLDEQLINNSIFVLPSYFEAMPMSILEAMAYKNIVIATYVGGIPQIIKNNVNGFLVQPGDVQNMEKIIKKIIGSDFYKKNIPIEARKTIIEKFNIKKNIKKLVKIYNEIQKEYSDE